MAIPQRLHNEEEVEIAEAAAGVTRTRSESSSTSLGCSAVPRLGLMARKVQRVGEQEQPPGGFMLIPYDDKSCGGDHLMLQICISNESNFEL